jgi:hypothetical protein
VRRRVVYFHWSYSLTWHLHMDKSRQLTRKYLITVPFAGHHNTHENLAHCSWYFVFQLPRTQSLDAKRGLI